MVDPKDSQKSAKVDPNMCNQAKNQWLWNLLLIFTYNLLLIESLMVEKRCKNEFALKWRI
jgi:hypothetical protein